MKKVTLLIVAIIACTGFAISQTNLISTNVYEVITRETSRKKMKDIQVDLLSNGIVLKIIGINRRFNGNINSISLLVKSDGEQVTYSTADFAEIIIERNQKIAIGVRAIH